LLTKSSTNCASALASWQRGQYAQFVIDRILKLFFAAMALCLANSAVAQGVGAVPSEGEVPVALLVDITSGQVLHQRGADRRFVPASITKVMTLYHAFELIEDGELDPRQAFTMRQETWDEWNGEGTTMWIKPDEPVLVDDLLTGIANISANDASVILAEGQAGSVAEWTAGMTVRAHALGMVSSHFGTPNGWPDEAYTFTTANDLVLLAEAMLRRHPDKYARYIGRRSFEYNGVEQYNYDPLIARTEGADGIKTGFTNEAGFGYLGTAERDGQRLVMVVAGAYSQAARSRAARDFIEWGFGAFDRERLFGKDEVAGYARVQGGDMRSVAIKTDRTVFVNVPRGRTEDLQFSIAYDGPVRAPFEADEEIATLVIHVPGMEPARVPLLAAQGVDEAAFFDRITNAFAGWLG